MKPRRIIPYLLLCLALSLVFYHFGRPVWHPWKIRVLGGRTVAEVLVSTHDVASARFENLEMLTDGEPIALLAFKKEQRLEVWKQSAGNWVPVSTYPFTSFSGTLGPKLKEGDGQIPEGIYEVEGLNPNSSYHLSIKVNYPNAFDRRMAKEEGRTNLGGDIFIHGENVTIGCIPIGNDAIEEVFHLVAANGYRHTPVIIAPFDMRQSPDRTLEISSVTWEEVLYDDIKQALRVFSPVVAEFSK